MVIPRRFPAERIPSNPEYDNAANMPPPLLIAAGRVYVTVLPDVVEFRRHSGKLAWKDRRVAPPTFSSESTKARSIHLDWAFFWCCVSPASYFLRLTPAANPKVFGERIAPLDDPRSIEEALRGKDLGRFWKYRIGDYRLICDIQDDIIKILVLQVGHGREVYRR